MGPFKFILVYKFSQDHIELLFACIRGKNGFNNSPDARQLKSALKKKIILRVANISSKHYNCLVFENEVSPIFSLKWTKNWSPLLENTHESCSNEEAFLGFNQMNFSYYQDATLVDILEGINVRKILKDISCDVCAGALAQSPNNLLIPHSFVTIKDNGGLFLCRWTCGK